MKKIIAGLAVVSLLAVGAIAYAHGPGSWGGGGQMMGPGYGGHMMGPGYGGHMMGMGGYGNDPKFLDETAELRKELHSKKFEYSEALRNPKTETETVTKLEDDIRNLQESIREKAPRTAYRGTGGYGCR
jgi:hypothetical protein